MVLGPLFLQHIHLDRVVPAALEILGAHQDLFVLCALVTKVERVKPFSAMDEVEGNKGLKIKAMPMTLGW